MTKGKIFYAIAFSQGDNVGLAYYNNRCQSICNYYDRRIDYDEIDCYESEEDANNVLTKNQEDNNKYMQEKGLERNERPKTYFLIKVREIIEPTVVGYEYEERE